MTTTPDVNELVFRRVHRASPEVLFDCMTKPEHLKHFWGPVGMSTPSDQIVVDLRPGGSFETTMVSDTDGSTYTMRAVYQEIDRPILLSWVEAESGMTSTVTFTALGDGRTEVVTHQREVPAFFRSPAAQAGFLTSLDRFDTYIASFGGTSGG